MKTYAVTFHLIGRCCGRKRRASQTINLQAEAPDEALRELRKRVHGARVESVEEIEEVK